MVIHALLDKTEVWSTITLLTTRWHVWLDWHVEYAGGCWNFVILTKFQYAPACLHISRIPLYSVPIHPSREPGLVDRVLALHAGSQGFYSHRGHMSKRFFRSNRPGYPHPVSSELENSGIRVAVGDCSVTERRRWRPPYQTGKTVHVHAKHYKHNEDGRTAPGVCGNGSVPLSHSGNVVTRIGTHTHSVPRWNSSSNGLLFLVAIAPRGAYCPFRVEPLGKGEKKWKWQSCFLCVSE